MAIELAEGSGGVTLAVKVVPGASRDRVAGAYGGGLKVTVAQAAQKGAANQAVVRLLADLFAVSPRQVHIVHGHLNPRKTVRIDGLTAAEARAKLSTLDTSG